jgi:hypothetical protein
MLMCQYANVKKVLICQCDNYDIGILNYWHIGKLMYWHIRILSNCMVSNKFFH